MQNIELQSMGDVLKTNEEASSFTQGYSMYPMLRHHKDVVTVKRVDRALKKSDVVLYPGNDGKFILHRIMKIKGYTLIIRGDNNYFTEKVNKNQIIGILKEFYREGKYINCSSDFKYKLYSFYICHSYWLRFIWKRLVLPLLVKIKHKIIKK